MIRVTVVYVCWAASSSPLSGSWVSVAAAMFDPRKRCTDEQLQPLVDSWTGTNTLVLSLLQKMELQLILQREMLLY